jgi:hypothetical protein
VGYKTREPLKSASFEIHTFSFVPTSKIFVWGACILGQNHWMSQSARKKQRYASQTKILEGGTKEEIQIFD